jgi:hypothetical protein
LLAALPLLLAGCARPEPPRAEWIIPARVEFRTADGAPREAPPTKSARLWMPWVLGDLYGAPDGGELAPVALQGDYQFTLDLNATTRIAQALAKETTEFTETWVRIEPAEARVARLLPYLLEADGIAPLGEPEWMDASGQRLMLLYFDRAARIVGQYHRESLNLEFDVVATAPGYVWVIMPKGSGIFKTAPFPRRVTLAVFPPR